MLLEAVLALNDDDGCVRVEFTVLFLSGLDDQRASDVNAPQ